MQIKVISVRFLEDDVYEGSLPFDAYENAQETLHDVDTPDEAATLIKSYGLTFEATGNEWAAHPDGSQIIDYSTGRREEVSAHFWPEVEDSNDGDEFVAQVIELVG